MPSSNPFTQAYGQLHTNSVHCARALVHFSRVFLCHPYLHAYGSFLAENFQDFILVFLKKENLDLHEIELGTFYSFFLTRSEKTSSFEWVVPEIEKFFRHPNNGEKKKKKKKKKKRRRAEKRKRAGTINM